VNDRKAHREKREIPVDGLVIGKKGPRLQPAAAPSKRKLKDVETPAGTLTSQQYSGPGEFFAASMTLDQFAALLESRADLNRPVVNLTGLPGLYKFDLHWMPVQENGSMGLKDPGLIGAVRDQLGLRLEKRNGMYDVLVVDRVERAQAAN